MAKPPSVSVVSPLTREECVARLSAAIDSPTTILGKRPAIGTVSADGFYLRKRIFSRNSFQTRIIGTLTPAGGGTNIQCDFGEMPRGVVIAGIVGVVILLVGVCAPTAALLSSRGIDLSPYMPQIIAIMVGGSAIGIVFGFAVIRFGRWLARDERAFLIKFVSETLDARPAS